MKDNLFPYIARLFDNRGNIVGSGFLTSSQRLVTASHVVLDSLDVLDRLEENLLQVTFDLPLIEPGRKHNAKLSFLPENTIRHLRAEQSDFLDDFVVLEIEGYVSEAIHKIVFQSAASLTGHHFWTFGFLDNYSDGITVTGEILGPGLPGILQLNGENPVSHFVQKGFSGSPVWDIELGAVVGMIVAAEERGKQFAIALTLDTILKSKPILAIDALKSMRLTYQKNLCQTSPRPKFEVTSPLTNAWDNFRSFLPWHEQIAEPLKRIRHFAGNFHDLIFLANQIGDLHLDTPYEKLLADVRHILEQATEKNVFRILRAHKKRLEGIVELKAPQIRKLKRKLNADENFLLQIDAIRKNLFDIKKLLATVEFQRCFCITGGLGSGKTHFLHHAQSLAGNEIHRYDEQFILLFELPLEQLDFNKLLLGSFDRHFELTFPSIEFIHQHFTYLNKALEELSEQDRLAQRFHTQRNNEIFDDERFGYADSKEFETDTPVIREKNIQDFQPPELRFTPPPAHIQLILAIDDIARWSLRHNQLIPIWIKVFKEWTAYPEIFWISTMPLNFYPTLMIYSGTNRDVWQRYGYRKGFKIPNIGGWIALDNLNIQEETGLLLIKETTMLTESAIQMNWLMKEVKSHEYLKRILCNPFNAWALIETLPSMQVHTIIDLNFIDFVQKFRDRQFSTILATDINLLSEEPLREIHLFQFVELIAGCLPKHNSEHPLQKVNLLKDVVKGAEIVNYDFPDRKRAELALQLLSLSNLLELRETTSTHTVPIEIVEILFEPFWHYVMACKFSNDYPEAPKSSWVLEARLSQFRNNQLTGVLEFYLLLLSQHGFSIDTCLTIFDQVLISRLLPKSAVWYAGAKSTPPLQSALIPALEKFVKEKPGQENLYALMYFIGELSYSQINFPRFALLLKGLYPGIKENGFEQFYVFLVNQALGAVQEPADIITAMPYFTGCELIDIKDATITDVSHEDEWDGYTANSITAEVAKLVVNRLQELVIKKHQRITLDDDCYREIITLLLGYLKNVKNEFLYKSSLPQKEAHWKRQLFREWVLFHFLGVFIDEKEEEAYAFLFEQQWYEHPALSSNKLLALQMEQEANIAFGRLMWTGRRYKLIDLVEALSTSDNQIDRVNAFHIIRHTVPTSGGALKGNIDEALHPSLRDLYLDSAMDETLEVDIFEVVFRQLGDYNKLRDIRKARISKSPTQGNKKRRKFPRWKK